jgi:hypothetical protein
MRGVVGEGAQVDHLEVRALGRGLIGSESQ